jgi:hypothetical protein
MKAHSRLSFALHLLLAGGLLFAGALSACADGSCGPDLLFGAEAEESLKENIEENLFGGEPDGSRVPLPVCALEELFAPRRFRLPVRLRLASFKPRLSAWAVPLRI